MLDEKYNIEALETLIPELKKSEDEKMKEAIIATIHLYYGEPLEDEAKQMIAWLEKHGEHKPAEFSKGEDYGIDGLYAAADILQKTLGKVDGYQTDDGILEHECAISAVKELSKQKPFWSEEDEKMFDEIIDFFENGTVKLQHDLSLYSSWLKSFKGRVQSNQSNGQSNDTLQSANEKPLFNVGDWVVDNDCGKVKQVSEIQKNGYGFWNGDYSSFESAAKNYHLWTIEDAKDGDTLVASDGSIFLFAGIDDCACRYYAALTADNVVCIGGEKHWETTKGVRPATSEEKKRMLRELRLAGYNWHKDTKEVVDVRQTNCIWHSADEEPYKYKKVLVEWKWPNVAEILYECVISPFRYDFEGKTILRWAYLEDLIK